MKYPFIAIILSQLFCFNSIAQSTDMSIGRVKALLCKKWVRDYIQYGDQKIYNSANSADYYYEFKDNNIFYAYTSTDKTRSNGTWEFISEKKLIKFGAKGNFDTVYSLAENKLVTQVKVAEGTPRIFQVFKVSN
jgi:hypothetical protein